MLLEEEDCDLGFYHSYAGGSSKARLVWSMSEAVTESSKSYHHSVFPQHLLSCKCPGDQIKTGTHTFQGSAWACTLQEKGKRKPWLRNQTEAGGQRHQRC